MEEHWVSAVPWQAGASLQFWDRNSSSQLDRGQDKKGYTGHLPLKAKTMGRESRRCLWLKSTGQGEAGVKVALVYLGAVAGKTESWAQHRHSYAMGPTNQSHSPLARLTLILTLKLERFFRFLCLSAQIGIPCETFGVFMLAWWHT